MLVRPNLAEEKKPRFSFKPDYIAESVADIDFELLINNGITACFIDLDSTVVVRGMFEVDQRFTAVLKKTTLDVYIATNRPKSRELKNLIQDLNAQGAIHPHGILGKPLKRYYLNALRDKGLKRQEVVMIGDRYIQDILGANRAGIYSLLVHKFGGPTGLMDKWLSHLEKLLTKRYSRVYVK